MENTAPQTTRNVNTVSFKPLFTFWKPASHVNADDEQKLIKLYIMNIHEITWTFMLILFLRLHFAVHNKAFIPCQEC